MTALTRPPRTGATRRSVPMLAVALALPFTARAATAQEDLPVIPMPAEIARGDGAFRIDASTRVTVDDAAPDNVHAAAERWAVRIRAAAGVPLPVARGGAGARTIHLAVDRALGLDVEGYRLEVTPDRISVRGGGPAAVFYGLQTLRQLLPPELERGQPSPGSAWTIPAVRITDEPRFRYRGMHLDVARHFFPVDFVKSYIDRMALYKFNTFHWHLTEDQGWRIEIERYPRLTEVGAWRKETVVEKNFDPFIGDGIPYGGFYTQDEVREVVAYAAERFVRVIPEIEMPGHSLAALASYPELACTPGPFEVATRWGVFEDIYCPKEETFTFLENVLTEVMALFPSEYIHIGGDEAPKRRWRESPIAQDIIRREGLEDENELQSWFIQRIERFLNAHGRRLIGWDEILEGGLPPEATVMSWRGMAGGIEAAREGHDVIMTPTSHLYFDYYQGPPASEPFAIGGNSPLPKVYDFEPVPPELSAAQAAHIIGAQGNVWTEYMKTTDHVEYMVFPRLLALSEVVWSPRAARDWPSFRARLDRELRRLDALGVNYRPLGPESNRE
jgi:hexosaminidase